MSFERTLYEVAETAGQVEVCVILTSPDTDIFENVVGVEVFEHETNKTNEFFPMGAVIASKFQYILYDLCVIIHIKVTPL